MGPLSRRNMLQMMGAAAFAGPLLGASRAFAARQGELNILCWEGYNSAQVLDPFRAEKGATVRKGEKGTPVIWFQMLDRKADAGDEAAGLHLGDRRDPDIGVSGY